MTQLSGYKDRIRIASPTPWPGTSLPKHLLMELRKGRLESTMSPPKPQGQPWVVSLSLGGRMDVPRVLWLRMRQEGPELRVAPPACLASYWSQNH